MADKPNDRAPELQVILTKIQELEHQKSKRIRDLTECQEKLGKEMLEGTNLKPVYDEIEKIRTELQALSIAIDLGNNQAAAIRQEIIETGQAKAQVRMAEIQKEHSQTMLDLVKALSQVYESSRQRKALVKEANELSRSFQINPTVKLGSAFLGGSVDLEMAADKSLRYIESTLPDIFKSSHARPEHTRREDRFILVR